MTNMRQDARQRQFNEFIRQNPGCTATEIAEHSQLLPGSARRILGRMSTVTYELDEIGQRRYRLGSSKEIVFVKMDKPRTKINLPLFHGIMFKRTMTLPEIQPEKRKRHKKAMGGMYD